MDDWIQVFDAVSGIVLILASTIGLGIAGWNLWLANQRHDREGERHQAEMDQRDTERLQRHRERFDQAVQNALNEPQTGGKGSLDMARRIRAYKEAQAIAKRFPAEFAEEAHELGAWLQMEDFAKVLGYDEELAEAKGARELVVGAGLDDQVSTSRLLSSLDEEAENWRGVRWIAVTETPSPSRDKTMVDLPTPRVFTVWENSDGKWMGDQPYGPRGKMHSVAEALTGTLKCVQNVQIREAGLKRGVDLPMAFLHASWMPEVVVRVKCLDPVDGTDWIAHQAEYDADTGECGPWEPINTSYDRHRTHSLVGTAEVVARNWRSSSDLFG